MYADAILANPQLFTLSRMGRLSATVKGLEPIRKAFEAADKAYAQSRDIAAQDSFSPYNLNNLNHFLWGVAFVKFSTAPVGVGDTWTFTPPADDKAKRNQPFGSIEYTLRSRDKGVIALDAEVIALEPHGKDKPAEMKFSFRIELDAKSGWPKMPRWKWRTSRPRRSPRSRSRSKTEAFETQYAPNFTGPMNLETPNSELRRRWRDFTAQAEPPESLREMIEFYWQTGICRPADLERLLGNPTKSVEVGPNISLGSFFHSKS